MSSWRTDKRKTAERGYGARWQREAKAFLREPANVLCRMCRAEGKTTIAKVVDHVKPHRGDQALFWDRSNWQPLCVQHHNGDKQRMENGKAPRQRTGLDGWPIPDRHRA